MMSPIKLILASLLALISACSESANQPKPVQQSRDSAAPAQAFDTVTETTPSRFIGGLTPNQRPANAPTIREFTVGDQQTKQALTGISQPVPASLDFINDQEAWFTPFNRPGMLGYYDLREWHTNTPAIKRASQ